MKKLQLFSAIAIVAITACATACSSEEPVAGNQQPTEQTVDSFSELNRQLDAFNQRFKQRHAIETRGFFSRLWRTIKADIVINKVDPNTPQTRSYGVYKLSNDGLMNDLTGNVTKANTYELTLTICISASIEAWKYQAKTDDAISTVPHFSNEMKAEINKLYNEAYDIDSQAGYYHNLVISNLAEKQPEIFMPECTIDEVIDAVAAEMSAIGLDVEITDSSELTNKIEYYFDNIMADTEEETYQNLLRNNPEQADEIKLLENAYQTLSVLDSKRIYEYADSSIVLIRNSNIDEADKVSLISGITVGAGSTVLWRDAQQNQ